MNEKLLEYFNDIEKHHWWWEGRREILRQELSHRKKLKVLDIGCGTGETMSFVKSFLKNPDVIGVDNSQVAVNFATKRGHKVIKVNALKLPFEDNSFDVILILDVIEHIKDDRELLSEAKRVLRPGGKIIVTAPALQFIWSQHDTGQGHQRRYTRHMMRNLADSCRLEITRLTYFNFFLSPAIIVIRLLSRLPIFGKLGEYDSDLNFKIAKGNFLNSLLRLIFVTEIKLMKYVSFPIGISVCAVLRKNDKTKNKVDQ